MSCDGIDEFCDGSLGIYQASTAWLDKSLLPLENNPKIALVEKVGRYAVQFFTQTLPALLFWPIAALIGAIGGILQKCNPFRSKTVSLQPPATIETAKLARLVKNLKFGAATSEYQLNGAVHHPNSNWARWEKTKFPDGKPHIERGDQSGEALSVWNNPDIIISRLQEIGMNHYRFSVEWSMIEPEKGKFSETALQHYVNFCQRLRDAGIEPMITLHHFSEPIWFEDEGGFEKEENIAQFVRFSEKIFEALSPYVQEWGTINEPGLFAFGGWLHGSFPPGKHNVELTGLVIKHMLMAHCQVYDRLKAMPNGEQAKIGIVHDIMRFRSYSWWNPLTNVACDITTRIVHDAVMKFFKTGKFEYRIPCMANLTFEVPDIAKKFDFFGLNYYSYPLIGMQFSKEIMAPTCYPHEKMTNMPYRYFPEGFDLALEECRGLNKPIYVTEVGADLKTEAERVEFMKAILQSAHRALAKGIDLRAIDFWSLIDNFEWAMGWDKHFGLYKFDPETKKIEMRDSGRYLQEFLRQARELEAAAG